MSGKDQNLLFEETKQTLADSKRLLDRLGNKNGHLHEAFTMAQCHRDELGVYLEAYHKRLDERIKELQGQILENATVKLPASSIHMLATQRFELDSAMRFVTEAFVKPREGHDSWALQAADWLCVEGFQIFLKDSPVPQDEHPIGPIVAVDSQRSPAVWAEDESMKIPALFSNSIVVKRGAADAQALPPFPIVCLPSYLIQLPIYYPLLSHEVGHALDNVLQFSTAVLSKLQTSRHLKYWTGWMREITADAVGIALSGEAFAIALETFVRGSPPDREFTPSHRYPPVGLRLAFIYKMLQAPPLNLPVPTEAWWAKEIKFLPDVAAELLADFDADVLDPVITHILNLSTDRSTNQDWIEKALLPAESEGFACEGMPSFRAISSLFTKMTGRTTDLTYQRFKLWVNSVPDTARPKGLYEKSTWNFQVSFIPSLRPTLLANDGLTKKPPALLMVAHQEIAFVGATQKWLLGSLPDAFALRRQVHQSGLSQDSAWQNIEIYFASDLLLAQVERYDKDRRWTLDELATERDNAIKDLKALFAANPTWARRCVFLEFDGPALFCSYWDWYKPGVGRIHISAQLAGRDISTCPAVDHVWTEAQPSDTYRAYQEHLKTLRARARVIWEQSQQGPLLASE